MTIVHHFASSRFKLSLLVFGVLCLTIIICICASISAWFRGYPVLLTNQREVTIVWGKWQRDDTPLTIDNSRGWLLPDEHTRLQALGLSGDINFLGKSTRGNGKPVRMVVIMYRQLNSSIVELPIPSGEKLIYIQNESGFDIYPPDTPTLTRNVELYIPDYDLQGTFFRVDVPGGTTGGGVFDWSE